MVALPLSEGDFDGNDHNSLRNQRLDPFYPLKEGPAGPMKVGRLTLKEGRLTKSTGYPYDPTA